MLSSTVEPGDIWYNDFYGFHNIIVKPDTEKDWWVTWVVELNEYNYYHVNDFEVSGWVKIA